MKKIGLLTFHETTNYGAILHTYALQKKIRQMGTDCEVIDYKCSNIQKRELPMRLLDINSVRRLGSYILSTPGQTKKYRYFCEFIKKRIKLSSEVYTKNNVYKCGAEYDRFIAGSDIVWELNVTGEDYTYFLDFIKDDSKKYSYSSSFGYENIPNKYFDNCKDLLSRFIKIAVREYGAQKIISGLLGKEVPVVLDPTLLLSKEEWFEITGFRPKTDKYILVYFVDDENKVLSFAKGLSAKTGFKTVLIGSSRKATKGVINVKNPSIEEFLGWIRYADYIITASYHGMLFSLNFQKQFFYYNRAHKDRMDTVVNDFYLQERNIDCAGNFDFSPINYDNINVRLEELRKRSLDILRDTVEF